MPQPPYQRYLLDKCSSLHPKKGGPNIEHEQKKIHNPKEFDTELLHYKLALHVTKYVGNKNTRTQEPKKRILSWTNRVGQFSQTYMKMKAHMHNQKQRV